MADFSIPYPNFQPGTAADSEQMDANFAALAALVGTNNFSANNYLTDGASMTANLDALDIALKALSDLLTTNLKQIPQWTPFDNDANQPVNIEIGGARGITLANAVLNRLQFQFRAGATGYHQRLVPRLCMSTTSASAISLGMAYRVVPLGTSHSVTTNRWKASTAYTAGAKVIGLASDGWREYTAAGGTSGASEPTWPTTGTVADNGWNWTAGSVIFKSLTLSYTVGASAYGDFEVDSSSLQVPSSEIAAATDMVEGFFYRAAVDAHAGDAYLMDGWQKLVEA